MERKSSQYITEGVVSQQEQHYYHSMRSDHLRSSKHISINTVYIAGKIKPQQLRQLAQKVASRNIARKCVPVPISLAITLRYLATGDSLASLMYLFKVSKELIARIVPETCKALINVLKENIKMPNTLEEWIIVERQFDHLCNFPHCIGAMDGKHVVIQAPSNTGSDFYNCDFSIVLLALVDANYKFTYVDVGCKGRISDGGVFKNTGLYANLQQGILNLPEPYPLPGRNKPIPHVIVADDVFALDKNLMKPYPGQNDKRSK
ncbi:hypothetical protein evm_005680 [Chilo suppressalis]|nr:hypothetical protein evm_005680 [Chilo suppressalis]